MVKKSPSQKKGTSRKKSGTKKAKKLLSVKERKELERLVEQETSEMKERLEEKPIEYISPEEFEAKEEKKSISERWQEILEEEPEGYPIPKTGEIRILYDEVRSNLPSVPETDVFVITASITDSLNREEIDQIIEKIRNYKFPEEDEGEHNFIAVEHNGEQFIFQFDWYGGQEGHRIVATLMRPEER